MGLAHRRELRGRICQTQSTFQCRYFSWTADGPLIYFVRRLPAKTHITIVGHSYGADAAFSLVAVHRVDVLISIDPVGRFRPSWTNIRAGAKTWLNVRAEPSEDRDTRDDLIAGIGGKYPRPPAAGQPGAPNYAFVANETHGAFRPMMRLAPKGISGASLLGGKRVG